LAKEVAASTGGLIAAKLEFITALLLLPTTALIAKPFCLRLRQTLETVLLEVMTTNPSKGPLKTQALCSRFTTSWRTCGGSEKVLEHRKKTRAEAALFVISALAHHRETTLEKALEKILDKDSQTKLSISNILAPIF